MAGRIGGWLLWGALLALLACARVPVHQDYDPGTDFAAYRSFDWYPTPAPASGDPHFDSPLLHDRVREALVRELAGKGLVKVADRAPDLFVSHQLAVRTRARRSGVGVGYGVGVGVPGGGIGVGVGGSPVSEIEQATLVIDVLDARSRKLLWRGTAPDALYREASPEKTTAAVERAVAAVLAQFPPPPSDP